MLTKDDLKAIVDAISPLIDARAKTTETLVKGEMRSVKDELKAEILASEERTKEELRAEILAARAEAKVDNLHLRGRIDKIAKSHERRLEALEEKTDSSNPNKN